MLCLGSEVSLAEASVNMAWGQAERERGGGSLRKPALHECEEVEWICKSPNSTCASEEGVIMEGLHFWEGEFK